MFFYPNSSQLELEILFTRFETILFELPC